jgi:hypothetical protein
MTDCEDLYDARIRAALEGNYTTWTLAWDLEYSSDNGNEANVVDVGIQITNDSNNILVYIDEYAYIWTINLTTGATVSQIRSYAYQDYGNTPSSLIGKYIVYIDEDTGHIIVLKDGVAFANITFHDAMRTVAISPNGKYIFVKYTINDGVVHNYRALYVGT